MPEDSQEISEKDVLSTPYSPEATRKELEVGEKFTDQQDAFIDFYMTCFDPKKAAEVAKYSPWVVKIAKQKLLGNPRIRAEIDRRKAADRDKYADSNDRVRWALEKIAYADVKEAYNDDGSLKPISEIDDDLMFAVESIDSETRFEGRGEEQEAVLVKKLRLGKKMEALKEIAKISGMYAEDNKMLVEIGFKPIYQNLTKEQREKLNAVVMNRIENKKKK